MKKFILLLFVTVLLLTGCTALSEMYYDLLSSSTDNIEDKEISNISEQNSELIDSFINMMKLDETKNSVAGFASESTFEDVLIETDNDKISTVFLSYYSELASYPALVTYIFKNRYDENGDEVIGNPTLAIMTFDVFKDKNSTSEEQLKEIVDDLDAVLGEHTTTKDAVHYYWDYDDDYYCAVYTDADFVGIGAVARVYAGSKSETDLSSLFTYSFGTDIYMVYSNEKNSQLPEWFTEEMREYYYTDYSNHLIYEDGETSACLYFAAEDSELKLSGASFQTNLRSADIDEIEDILKYFADNMEDILGPANSRSIKYYNLPHLSMEWQGLLVKAYDLGNEGIYSVFVEFSEEYFAEY